MLVLHHKQEQRKEDEFSGISKRNNAGEGHGILSSCTVLQTDVQ